MKELFQEKKITTPHQSGSWRLVDMLLEQQSRSGVIHYVEPENGVEIYLIFSFLFVYMCV